MRMGLIMNIPDCIWRMEACTRSFEIDMKKRAASYLINVLKMEENMWPKLCLKEELRRIMNKYPSEWEKKAAKSFREVGDGRTIEIIYQGGEIGEIRGKLENLIKTKVEQEIQKDWDKTEKASFCRLRRVEKINRKRDVLGKQRI